MSHAELIKALKDMRGSGEWEKVAKRSGVAYSTIARIACNRMPNPGILTCEKIAAAISALSSERVQAPCAVDLAHDLVQREMDTITCPTSRPICADSARPTKPKSERR